MNSDECAEANSCRGVLSPCSDRDSSVPFFRNHCPSMLPVTEKAQQDPHMPWKTQTHSKHEKLLIKTWHVTRCVVIFVCRWLLVPGSSQNWRHRDPSNPSWRGRGPWQERQVSLACGESTDSAGGSGTWSEILPLVEILKRKKDKSQSWFKGMFLKRSWCQTCKLKDVDPHLKLCNTQTHTHQLSRWTWWLRIQLNLDPETGASQRSSGSRGRSADAGLSLQEIMEDNFSFKWNYKET